MLRICIGTDLGYDFAAMCILLKYIFNGHFLEESKFTQCEEDLYKAESMLGEERR